MSPQELFPDIKKILLIKLKHIGDVLLTSPCIRALNHNFPRAEISVLVNEGTESMFSNHPLVRETLVFPRKKIKGVGMKRIWREYQFVREVRKRNFDMTVDLTSGDRAAWISLWSRARYRLAYHPGKSGFFGKKLFYTHPVPQPVGMDIHEVQKNLGLLEHFGIRTPLPRLELHSLPAESLFVEDELKKIGVSMLSDPYIVVHPTSRWMFKCWEDQRMAEAMDWIQKEKGIPVIVTCGPDPKEKTRVERILSFCQSQPHVMIGKFTLTEWAVLVENARLFFGVDSAPMHIAASQDVPTLALFGPTGYQNWRPWEVSHEVLVHDCPCSRDRQPHCDWSRTRACMDAITLEEVKKAIDQLLERSRI